MTCNHANGDQQAEKVCRASLAAFKFNEQGTPAKIDLPELGVRECDDYLQKFRASSGRASPRRRCRCSGSR